MSLSPDQTQTEPKPTLDQTRTRPGPNLDETGLSPGGTITLTLTIF